MTKIRKLVLAASALVACMTILGGCYARVGDPGRGGHPVEEHHDEHHDDHHDEHR
jgi:hypothetical protein